jgi:hypothetical protein
VKANPWWSTPLMPIVFLFSAIVSGIAAVLLIYMVYSAAKRVPIDMPCLDTIAKYLFYAFIVDFALELLDLVHRIYEADESFHTLDFMVQTRLYGSQVVGQIVLGTLVPLGLLALTQLVELSERARKGIYALAASLTLAGIFADALERGHRRPALLEELPRLHHLQDGLRHPRGAAARDPGDAPAPRRALDPHPPLPPHGRDRETGELEEIGVS